MRTSWLALLLIIAVSLLPYSPVTADGQPYMLEPVSRLGALPAGNMLSFPGEDFVRVVFEGENGFLLKSVRGDVYVYRFVSWSLTVLSEWSVEKSRWRYTEMLCENNSLLMVLQWDDEVLVATKYSVNDGVEAGGFYSEGPIRFVGVHRGLEAVTVVFDSWDAEEGVQVTVFRCGSGRAGSLYVDVDRVLSGPVEWSGDSVAFLGAVYGGDVKTIYIYIINISDNSYMKKKVLETRSSTSLTLQINGRAHIVAYKKGGGTQLYIYNADTNTTRSIPTGQSSLKLDGARWSPNGRYLAIPGYDGRQDNLLVVDTLNHTIVYTAKAAFQFGTDYGVYPFGWSPDSKYLVITNSNTTAYDTFLKIVDIANRTLVYNDVVGLSYKSVYKAISWNQQLRLLHIPVPKTNPDTINTIWTTNSTKHSTIAVFIEGAIRKVLSRDAGGEYHIIPIIKEKSGNLTIVDLRLVPLITVYNDRRTTIAVSTPFSNPWINLTLTETGTVDGISYNVTVIIRALVGYVVVTDKYYLNNTVEVSHHFYYGILILLKPIMTVNSTEYIEVIVNITLEPGNLTYNGLLISGKRIWAYGTPVSNVIRYEYKYVPGLSGKPQTTGYARINASLPYTADLAVIRSLINNTRITVTIPTVQDNGTQTSTETTSQPPSTIEPETAGTRTGTQTGPSGAPGENEGLSIKIAIPLLLLIIGLALAIMKYR